MEKRVFKSVDSITDKIQSQTGKAYSRPRIDEDGYHAYNADDGDDLVVGNSPTVNFRWHELAEMLGYNGGELATIGGLLYGCFDDDVVPRVGDKVVWRDPETDEEQDGYTITSVCGEIITIHHDNGSEAEVVEHELTAE